VLLQQLFDAQREIMNQHTLFDASSEDMPAKGVRWIDNKSLLTPTGGFLASGYTHTVNPYVGCAFAGAVCGTFCYAQHQHWIVRGRPWGLYGAKRNIRQAYRRDFDRIKRPRRGEPRPLRIYMSSSTDPYLPQEQRLGLTRAILEEMQTRPPDVLVVQTHNILIRRDLDLIRALAERCELWVSITVETDMDPVPGFPPHASRPAARLETLRQFREAGIRTQAAISPLMPLADPQTFAQALEAACDRVIVDYYLVGDGTHGARTRRTNFIQLLEQAGFGEWTHLEKLWEVRDLLIGVLGVERVLVSAEGFNAVGVKAVPGISTDQEERKRTPSPLDALQPDRSPGHAELPDPPATGITTSGLNQTKDEPSGIYEALRDHQKTNCEQLALLHSYLPLMSERFFTAPLPLPTLSCERDRVTRLGTYREKDGLALCHRINLNEQYMNRPLPELLATLTHELGHLWERLYGKPAKPPYHSALFRRKMRAIGIPCDQYGRQLGLQDPFSAFLREIGVEDVASFAVAAEAPPRQAGKSKLIKWSCACTNIRAAVEVEAECLRCGDRFLRA
jgi:DNA repair photolyase